MAKEIIIARGAEAVIIKQNNKLIKNRVPKSYRLPELDEKLRKLRTRSEAKIIKKLQKVIPVPKLINLDVKTKTIELEFIHGKKLSDNLESLDYQKICVQIGNNLAKIHDVGIIHGDLTTSNMIYVENNNSKKNSSKLRTNPTKQDLSINYNSSGEVYFIDFGLGFHSNKIEDKAVDLHLIKEALEAKHYLIHDKAFKAILDGYKISKNAFQVLKRLEKVEKRGRYKAQY